MVERPSSSFQLNLWIDEDGRSAILLQILSLPSVPTQPTSQPTMATKANPTRVDAATVGAASASCAFGRR